jgi:ApaG protein
MAYEKTTRDIRVRVEPRFMADQSSPAESLFFWAYTVDIANLGEETVELRARHWRITDATGKVQEVRGAGVVGEQPVLRPGARFEYTSGCPLPTSSGIMVGAYRMRTESGEEFLVDIPAFSLDSPHAPRTVN